MELTAQVARLEEGLSQLAVAQGKTETALTRLAEAQRHTELELGQLARELRRLLQWQQGEEGRRRGERYERDVARRAWELFAGGEGGPTDRESVERRLGEILAQQLDSTSRAAAGDDSAASPFLADLVWWKAGRVAVVEVSRVVDESDVSRAVARAATLRRAGADTLAVVIGDAWDDEDARAWAQDEGAEWKVGDDLSEGLIAFRRLPATA